MTTMHRQVYLITQRSFSLDKILENSRQYYPILTFYSKLKLVQTKKSTTSTFNAHSTFYAYWQA